jgi:nucleotide-binding universal stress UspA family protein
MRLLLAIDGSENSRRAVDYVASLLRAVSDVEITLFHVMKPLPRELLEHGGSDNPAAEAALSDRLRRDQGAWLEKERAAENAPLTQAREVLERAGFAPDRVSVKFGYDEDVAHNILEEATSRQCDTIVIGRHGTSQVRRLFGGGVTDQLLRNAKGFAIWIIE